MKIDFSNQGWQNDLRVAYTFRHSETPEFTQRGDCIEGGANDGHGEGFDAIALLSNERFSGAAHATLTCAFEDCGCAEIIIVPETKLCTDGAERYGACYEVVLYKDGINVWLNRIKLCFRLLRSTRSDKHNFCIRIIFLNILRQCRHR